MDREIFKQPIFYYVLVPLVFGLWPAWLFMMGLPGSKKSLEKEISDYNEARTLIVQVLDLDPQRLDYAKNKKSGEAFDYTTAVDQATRTCGILPTDYKISSSPVRRAKGQVNQDASVTIDKIDIVKFTRFLSIMHMRWSTLQCTNASLAKVKGEKDLWKADTKFIYYE